MISVIQGRRLCPMTLAHREVAGFSLESILMVSSRHRTGRCGLREEGRRPGPGSDAIPEAPAEDAGQGDATRKDNTGDTERQVTPDTPWIDSRVVDGGGALGSLLEDGWSTRSDPASQGGKHAYVAGCIGTTALAAQVQGSEDEDSSAQLASGCLTQVHVGRFPQPAPREQGDTSQPARDFQPFERQNAGREKPHAKRLIPPLVHYVVRELVRGMW
jgi:hypothetical protein